MNHINIKPPEVIPFTNIEIESHLPTPLVKIIFSYCDEDSLEILRDSPFREIVYLLDVSEINQTLMDLFSRIWPKPNELPNPRPLSEDLQLLIAFSMKNPDNNEYRLADYFINRLKKIKTLPLNDLDRINSIGQTLMLFPWENLNMELVCELVFREIFNMQLPKDQVPQFISNVEGVKKVIDIGNLIQDPIFRKFYYTKVIGKLIDPKLVTQELIKLTNPFKCKEVYESLALNSLERARTLLEDSENPQEYLSLFESFFKPEHWFNQYKSEIIFSFLVKYSLYQTKSNLHFNLNKKRTTETYRINFCEFGLRLLKFVHLKDPKGKQCLCTITLDCLEASVFLNEIFKLQEEMEREDKNIFIEIFLDKYVFKSMEIFVKLTRFIKKHCTIDAQLYYLPILNEKMQIFISARS